MSQSERSKRYAATKKGKAAVALKREREREKRQSKSLARKQQTQAEGAALIQANHEESVRKRLAWEKLHPQPANIDELIANPEKYGVVRTVPFGSARDRFVAYELEKIFPQLASLPEVVEGKRLPWKERASYELDFLDKYIFTVWENRRIPTSLLIPIFDTFKLSYMKHLRDRTGSCSCIGELSECGYTYEFDGETHHSIGRWEDACRKCRQYAWAELTTEMVLSVCAL
jgi:hypothetical protein